MKSCILTTFNFQVDQKMIDYHEKVIRKMIIGTNIEYFPLRYNLPNRYISHYESIDYGISTLFNEDYQLILVLDVDCIPLSTESLLYTFEKIRQGFLIGTSQRSMHIENNKHIYVGSPCIGFSKTLFERIGCPSFAPTNRGDTAEELTYIAEDLNEKIEMFRPAHYEKDPLNGPAWELESNDIKYGIGTTFINNDNLNTFYHLFESRVLVHNNLFYKKCDQLLYESENVEMFNPFGCYFLKHKVPDLIYNTLLSEINFVDNNLKNDDFVKDNDHSHYLAGKNSYQIRVNETFLKKSKLEDYILNIGSHYLEKNNLHSNNLHMGNMWINFSYKGDYNPLHNHDSLLSGVIYIENSSFEGAKNNVAGRSSFNEPGTTNFVHSLNNHPLNKFTYVNQFEKQKLLLFPSWLSHWVNPNNLDDKRITVAFNILGDL